MDAALRDYSTSPLTDPEKALLAFIEKVNADCASIGQPDIDTLHAQGWSDEAIYDAIMVCGLFNFYNRWVDATGVREMTEREHALSGKRLASQGYANDAEMRSGSPAAAPAGSK